MNADDVQRLFASMLSVPRLAGAACRGRPELFDLDHRSCPDEIERAQRICSACPAMAACRAWIDATPEQRRPTGVVAGMLLGPPAPASSQSKPAPDPSDDGAWLLEFLAARGGRVEARAVIAAAQAVGMSATRVRAARSRVAATEPTTHGRRAVWFVPVDEGRSA
ncbi:WhiB family transcriptional regulator [Mycobacterium sp. E2479]|uniref:WhiB family transcriptional regulator n=1 Tax=Mycobacterium sp. E2479 TaxID=1834134 RepID=UPI0009ED20E2|nr:WhiB family transcriptional regulator [Mycobacterium sp. E2479]